jgi:AIR synthase-related protein
MDAISADMPDLASLAAALRASRGIAAKADIGLVAGRLGITGSGDVPVGDDCAAIPTADGYTLFAIEGFINAFVATDPWFAGWCGVMVNISDVAAMGGRPIAIVDALWADGEDNAAEILAGLRAASEAYGVPIVGGHSNLSTDRVQLSTAILGHAKRLLTSFDACPGDRLVMAVDLRGRYRAPYANWEAFTDAPPERLRADIALLPEIAEGGLSRAGKDISQGGVVGTAAMFAECSGVAITIDVTKVPKPAGVPLERWLMTFPSFGYLLSVAPGDVAEVIAMFSARDIAAADIGAIEAGHAISITDGRSVESIRDFREMPLILAADEGASAEELVG